MPNISSLDRLKSQLQMTGLQQKNFQLYQIISQLIDFLRQGIDTSAAGLASVSAAVSAAIPPSTTNIVMGNFMPLDGLDGEEGIMEPSGSGSGSVGSISPAQFEPYISLRIL